MTQITETLAQHLEGIPQSWELTPLRDKRPYRLNWQDEAPIPRDALIEAIKNGDKVWSNKKQKYWTAHPTGYGIRLGRISGGIVAIDFDGQSAWELAQELSGGDLPDTVSFTSNRPGRHQRLYRIPEEYWDAIATQKLKTGVNGDDGKPEQLEFRWDGCQSVLPPSKHPDTGQYVWLNSPQDIEVADAPMWVIEKMLPEPAPEPRRFPSGQLRFTVPLRLPNTSDWTDSDWALSYLNALAPYRADDYDDWLAVGMALHSVDDSLLTEWDAWSQQSSKYKPGDCQKKWKSFKQTGVAIGTLGQMAKQDGWKSPFAPSRQPPIPNGKGNKASANGDSKSGGDSNGKAPRPPRSEQLSKEEVNNRIDALIEQGLSGAALRSELNQIAEASSWYITELYKLHREKLEDVERVELRDNTREQLESLLSASNAALNLPDYLHPNLAKPLLHLASRLSLKPELYLTTLLTVASSLHHPKTQIWLSKEDDFDQPASLYSAIVAPSSQKKSPVLKAIATKPLQVLQKEAEEEHKAQMEDYAREMKAWEEKKGDKGPPPEKPERATYYLTKTTGEGLEYQAARQPDQGMLYLSDELPAIIHGQNQYRGGKGSDKQDFLSYYDGTGHTTLRAKEGIKSELDSILLSILGGIQPKVMQSLLADCEDSDGSWARFLFVNQPAVAGRLHPDRGKIDLTGLLTDLYRKIRSLPPIEYTLSPEAFRIYQHAYNRYEQNRVNDPLAGMQSVWGKCEGRAGRLALNLHVLNAIAEGEAPSVQISAETMKRAIELTDYYANQVKAMYTEFSDSDALAPHLAKVIEMSLKRLQSSSQGWLKARDVSVSITKSKRPTTDVVRQWFGELVTLGKGEVKGAGRSLEFRVFDPNNPNVDECRQKIDKSSTAETTKCQGVEEFVDNVDNVDDFQEKLSTPSVDMESEDFVDDSVDTPSVMANPSSEEPPVEQRETEKNSFLSESSTLSTNSQDAPPVGAVAVDDFVDTPSTLENSSIKDGQPALVVKQYFQIGDRVRVLTGKRKGQEARVTHFSGRSYIFAAPKEERDNPYGYFKDELQKLDP